ncbi:hypothetical protein Ac2012v2_002808 [Leucoagaricus gongylophorus]
MTDKIRPDARTMDQEIESQEQVKLSPVVARNRQKTPLPRFQLFLVLLIQFSEPTTATVIYPFLNQFVRDTGITQGDDRETGYYAGVIESAFFLTEAATVFQWGWLSDRFGRKPILLLGPLGLGSAILIFGYSTSFWPMVLSRCIQGIFNGSIGVSKTIIVELSDSTNMGDALSMMPFMWSSGVTIGPLIGGVFSKPATRWPNFFGSFALFREYPYLLPCLTAAIISFSTCLIGFLGLKETNPYLRRDSGNTGNNERGRRFEVSSSDTLQDHNDNPNYGTTISARFSSPTLSEASVDSCQNFADPNDNKTATLRSLLRSRTMKLIVANFICFAFTERCYYDLTPLFYSTSIETGGLGLSPYYIGLIMSIWGFCNACFQINVVGRLIRNYGGASVYKNGGVGFGAWTVILIQLFFQFFSYMSYSSYHHHLVPMHLLTRLSAASLQVVAAETAPKQLIGSINGFLQMSGCAMRTFAPTFASSLFSFSIRSQIFGGYLVYVAIYSILLVGICFSRALPDTRRKCIGKSV